MRQRILAIVAAVALVAIAIVARSFIADDGGGNGGGSGGSKPVVACTPDLAAVCAALVADGRIAANPPSFDLAAAAKPAADVDGWITWDPAPGIANLDAEAESAPQPWQPAQALGASQLGVAIRQGSTPTYPNSCTQVSFGWSCLNGAAATGQGIGVGSGRTAESLTRLYPLALELIPTDGDITDVRDAQIRALIESPNVGQAPFPRQLRTLQTQPGALSFLVGPTGAFAAADRVTPITATPGADAVIAFAPRRTQPADLLEGAFDSDLVTKALREAGVQPGQGKLAPDDRAGDLYAVREKVG